MMWNTTLIENDKPGVLFNVNLMSVNQLNRVRYVKKKH